MTVLIPYRSTQNTQKLYNTMLLFFIFAPDQYPIKIYGFVNFTRIQAGTTNHCSLTYLKVLNCNWKKLYLVFKRLFPVIYEKVGFIFLNKPKCWEQPIFFTSFLENKQTSFLPGICTHFVLLFFSILFLTDVDIQVSKFRTQYRSKTPTNFHTSSLVYGNCRSSDDEVDNIHLVVSDDNYCFVVLENDNRPDDRQGWSHLVHFVVVHRMVVDAMVLGKIVVDTDDVDRIVVGMDAVGKIADHMIGDYCVAAILLNDE